MRPSRWQLRLLGPLEVVFENSTIDVGGPRQRALLAFLALNANRVVPRERIIDALWGEQPPRTARNSLQVAVHELRRAFPAERVQTHGGGYRLELDVEELDLDRFTRLVERARTEDPGRAGATLREALDLHRGVPLADVPDAPFVPIERTRIEELRLLAVERRVDADLAMHLHHDLVPELEALAAENPYRERFRAQLMLALYRSGRQADALEAFRAARAVLVEELGLEPSPELQELHAAVLRHDSELGLGATSPPTTNVPAPARPLVGRELELAAITALLRVPDTRLVTLTGTGGTGKTRLALEVAHQLLDDFDRRVLLVDLAPLRDPALVGPTTGRVLGIRDVDDELVPRIESAIGDSDTLLVFDNFEHVLDAAAFVSELLARTPRIRALATSREPLRIAAEQEYRVSPLELPAADASLAASSRSDAVALFVARAQTAQREFSLTAENAAAVVGICRALDGLPLALELAAPRVRVLSPAALLTRLENRLGVLEGGERDLPDRQRTLRAAIDWSYELLESPERTLLARLSVFAGGWTIEAAEGVCDADLASLASLLEKSLVRSTPSPGEPRFSMLETIREYALGRLSDAEEIESVRDRHAAYFATLAEGLEPALHTAPALDEAEREHDNVRAALTHALSRRDATLALRLCSFARLWYVRGYLIEGREWIEKSLSLDDGAPRERARVLYWSATLRWTSGEHELAIEQARESLRLGRAVDDERTQVHALTALGLAHLGAGDLLESRRFHAESLELARKLGHERSIANSLSNIADIEATLGHHDVAETLARESLEINRRIGDDAGMGVALLLLAASMLERGSDEDAVPMIVESVRCFRTVDFKDFLTSGLVALARAEASSDPFGAALLLGAARTVRASLGHSQFPWEQAWFDTTLERLRAKLGHERTEEALSKGSSFPDHTIDERLARSG